MSAFVCEDKTLNRITNALFFAVKNGGYGKPLPQPDEDLQNIMGSDPAQFGKTLYFMNVNAVEQRYPDCIGNPNNLPGVVDEAGNHVPYTYKATPASMIPSAAVLYKAIQSYLYQCTEGDVTNLPLYKALQGYRNTLACHIVERSQEYQNAPWG